MQRLIELLDEKKRLNELKQMLDKEACLRTWEGATYAKTLVKLVLIELELEQMEKEKAAHH
jgi:hypothetical protein